MVGTKFCKIEKSLKFLVIYCQKKNQNYRLVYGPNIVLVVWKLVDFNNIYMLY